jgi:hypothetical protein
VIYSVEGITHVRACPLAIDLSGGEAVVPPGALEVTFDSTQEGGWHQVYVNGHLAGVTAAPEDRRLIVSAPVGCSGPARVLLVEVVAVGPQDRWTDFGGQIQGFGADAGAEVRLSWQAGEYLDPNLASFDVFADGCTGSVDYGAPLNESPIPAAPGGLAPWGYGGGGYGVGAYGQAAARYEWTTDILEPGAWRLAVVAVDAAGNRLATAAEVAIDVTPVARPAQAFRAAAYDAQTRVATLAWDPSPDIPARP